MQLGEHELGVVEHVPVRVAPDLVSPGMSLALATPVLLPGVS